MYDLLASETDFYIENHQPASGIGGKIHFKRNGKSLFLLEILFLHTFPTLQTLLHKPTATLSRTSVSIAGVGERQF